MQYVILVFSNNLTRLLCLLAAPGGHMSITSLSIIGPVGNVIKVGQFITVLVVYSLGNYNHIILYLSYCLMIIDENVTDGTVDINIEGAVLNIPLCDALSYIGLGCPLYKNPNGIFNVTQSMPDVPDVS